jgi:hypothetical protein
MFAFPLDVITRRLQETQSSIGRRQEFVFQLSQQGGMDYFTFLFFFSTHSRLSSRYRRKKMPRTA